MKRRITYVFFYEAIALVIISTAFAMSSGKDAVHSGALGILTVVLAIVWNTFYNTVFERWEAPLNTRGRSLGRRVIHAVGFEGGLVAVTLPLFAWWLDLSLIDAFFLDASLTLFFVFFTFFYNWVFDLIFGPPMSAQHPKMKKEIVYD